MYIATVGRQKNWQLAWGINYTAHPHRAEGLQAMGRSISDARPTTPCSPPYEQNVATYPNRFKKDFVVRLIFLSVPLTMASYLLSAEATHP